MTRQVQTDWFVEPSDAHTNEVIARNLSATNQLNENVDIEDDKGVSHSVYQVESHSFITRLYRDRQKFSLRFNVYTRQGKNKPIRLWQFEGDKKKKNN